MTSIAAAQLTVNESLASIQRATSSIKSAQSEIARTAFLHRNFAKSVALLQKNERAKPGNLHRVRAVKEDPSTSAAQEKIKTALANLKSTWDGVEDKPTALLYGGGALVLLWFSSAIAGAFATVPGLPKLLELIGLGYCGWFVYRYLLFTSSRQELMQNFEDFTSRVSGETKKTGDKGDK